MAESPFSSDEGSLPTPLIRLLRCPVEGGELSLDDGGLVSSTGRRYAIADGGIPLFASAACSDDGEAQRQHYDTIAVKYLENLAYPHTKAYLDYLDDALLGVIDRTRLGTVAELCCGSGEALTLLDGRIGIGVGVDISLNMLRRGSSQAHRGTACFVQGDATILPLATGGFDAVFMLGGIHHVGDRRKLFAEIHRILKPGGHFYYREPLNDFPLWQALRGLIYRVSPTLDHRTERPLRRHETEPLLRELGFECVLWRPIGFVGFCLFMNSDVLVVNRLLRFVPGIERIVRVFCRLDDAALRMPGMASVGLQIIGLAVKADDCR